MWKTLLETKKSRKTEENQKPSLKTKDVKGTRKGLTFMKDMTKDGKSVASLDIEEGREIDLVIDIELMSLWQ